MNTLTRRLTRLERGRPISWKVYERRGLPEAEWPAEAHLAYRASKRFGRTIQSMAEITDDELTHLSMESAQRMKANDHPDISEIGAELERAWESGDVNAIQAGLGKMRQLISDG